MKLKDMQQFVDCHCQGRIFARCDLDFDAFFGTMLDWCSDCVCECM